MIAALLSVLPDQEARKAPRRIVNLAAALREEGAVTSAVRISDISIGGCRIEAESDLAAGTEVWLRMPGFETRRSRIVWANGRTAGCKFDIPLHPAEIDILIPPRPARKASEVFRRS
jgi:hypothetical protein